MKRFSKIFAVIFSLMMLFSMVAFPANAKIADSYINFSIRLEKVTTRGEISCADSGEDAVDLGNIYKVVVSLDSNVPVNLGQVGVVYDADLFDVCYGDDTGNYITYACDPNETGLTAAKILLGTLADADAYDANGVGGQTSGVKIKAYGPSHASAGTTFVYEKIDSSDERYTNAVKWAYTDLGATAPSNPGVFVTQYWLSNNNAKGIVEPEGQQDLAAVYLMLKNGKTDADVANTVMRMSLVNYCADATPTTYGSLHIWFGKSAASTADTVEYITPNGTEYVYTVSAKAPTVETSKKQVKFAWNEDGSAVQDAFTFRLISQINANDYADLFNLQADSATKAANIQKVGFVAGSTTQTNLADVKAAIENGAAINKDTGAIDGITGWQGATTDYVSLVNGVATFGCSLNFSAKPASDIQCCAFMQYLDADGNSQYVWCTDVATAKVNSSYDNYVSGWKTANPFAAA